MMSDFSPAVWPEQECPEHAANCSKCELCSQRTRMIWGEGNPKAPIIVILDNPGAREDKEGEPFVCGTRQTLQDAAYRAGLTMEDIFVTYILKCRPLRRYDKELARGACMDYLLQQIKSQNPEFAFCLGNTSVQWFFCNKEAEVKNLRGTWHNVRGLDTYVSYHPLAIRRRPNLLSQFMLDCEEFAFRFFKERG
jgi:DNA polymerase